MDNLARKGPNRVWDEGYKTMRVPIAIFDDVRKFMERRKQEYLAGIEGIELSEEDLPHSAEFSLPAGSSSGLIDLIKETIKSEMQSQSINSDKVEIPPPTLTSQERVKQLLMQRPNQQMTTLQIGELLDLPNSTAREATRTIAEEYPEIEKIAGRPNKFIYRPQE